MDRMSFEVFRNGQSACSLQTNIATVATAIALAIEWCIETTFTLSLPPETVDELMDFHSLVRALRVQLRPVHDTITTVALQSRHLAMCFHIHKPVTKVLIREVGMERECTLRHLTLVVLGKQGGQFGVCKQVAEELAAERLIVNLDVDRIYRLVGEVDFFAIHMKGGELHLMRVFEAAELSRIDTCHFECDRDYGDTMTEGCI